MHIYILHIYNIHIDRYEHRYDSAWHGLQPLLFVDLVPVLLVVAFLPQRQPGLVGQAVVDAIEHQVLDMAYI